MKTILIYYIEIVKQRCDNVLFIIQVRQCSLQDKIRSTHLQVMYLAQLRTASLCAETGARQSSPALYTEVSVHTPHCTVQATKVLVTTALAFFPFTLFKCQRFLFPLLPEKMHHVQRGPDAGTSLEWWHWEANPAHTSSPCRAEQSAQLCVPCFPRYPHPSFQPPFLRHVCHTPEL